MQSLKEHGVCKNDLKPILLYQFKFENTATETPKGICTAFRKTLVNKLIPQKRFSRFSQVERVLKISPVFIVHPPRRSQTLRGNQTEFQSTIARTII